MKRSFEDFEGLRDRLTIAAKSALPASSIEALGENLLGTFQSFGVAALPMRRWIRIVEPLNTTPRKCSNF